jgi:ketosteroid isomerase-like protein
MNARITIGKGITSTLRYVQGEGRDPVTNELLKLAPGQKSRATLLGGDGFGFDIETANDVEIGRRAMEHMALNQKSKTYKCRYVCVHVTLSWAKGQNPSLEEKNEAAQSAIHGALRMEDAMWICYEHSDEDYVHIHIVCLKINPATRRAYDLHASQRKLSAWALQYEIDHGGVINTRRQIANERRQAIANRDAGAVLEAMTKECAVFTPAQLERAINKEIYWKTGAPAAEIASVKAEQLRFQAETLAHPEIRARAEKDGGPATHYTTRAVLEDEEHVRQAAARLAASNRHGCGEELQARIEASDKFRRMTDEQLSAFLRATGPEGLALISGQAGTGKSFAIAAIRTAYEQAGCQVVGLAPTNIVKEDLQASGFAHAATVHKELFDLANGRAAWSRDTVAIVDEAAMLDTRIMALLTTTAAEAGGKLILVGDDRQLSSIDRGGMFAVLKRDYGAAEITKVQRQIKLDERRASEMMAEGNFNDALRIYDGKGAINWTRTEREARAALVVQWAEDTANRPDATRFVYAYTNDTVDDLNAALRAVLQARGELGPDHEFETARGRHRFAVGDRIQFTANDHKQGIANGRAGTIAAIKPAPAEAGGSHIAVSLDTPEPTMIAFDAEEFKEFRHGYAGTIYKSQGKTLDQTYLFHSEHWRSAPSYVALTRHRGQTRLFVARNTAKNLAELARQIARPDERRAASEFYPVGPADTVAPVTAAELNARFAAGRVRTYGNRQSRRPTNDNARILEPPVNDNKREASRSGIRPTASPFTRRSNPRPAPATNNHRMPQTPHFHAYKRPQVAHTHRPAPQNTQDQTPPVSHSFLRPAPPGRSRSDEKQPSPCETPPPLLKQKPPAGEIGKAFRDANEALTKPHPSPATKKSKRSGDDDKGAIPRPLPIVAEFQAVARAATRIVRRIVRRATRYRPKPSNTLVHLWRWQAIARQRKRIKQKVSRNKRFAVRAHRKPRP